MSALFEKLCSIDCLYSAWKNVKNKNSSGGIDGLSVLDFEDNLSRNLIYLQKELTAKTWLPEPYLRIEIKKNETEKRKLGLLTIKDKIVQQAIRSLIEPRFENLFLNNSYGYRPARGHLRAIRRSVSEFNNKDNHWVVQLDLDNYFDTINHDILFSRLKNIIVDVEIVRLIELCVKMGVVTTKRQWTDMAERLPQGAVLSPLLANFYLHPFDQFVTSKTNSYVRYADDFIFLCSQQQAANEYVEKASIFLQNRLLLKLNEPIVIETKAGIEFLGVTLQKGRVSISVKKQQILTDRINSVEMSKGGISTKSIEQLEGIKNYYGKVLPKELLSPLDDILIKWISHLIESDCSVIPNKTRLSTSLYKLPFFTVEAELKKKAQIARWLKLYTTTKKVIRSLLPTKSKDTNKLLINKKKKEYQKRESEGTELIVSTFGSFIGKNNKGIVVKQYGKTIHDSPSVALNHITVTTRGVSISSDAIYYCMTNNIPIDFFDNKGKHYASILSPIFVKQSVWQAQSNLSSTRKIYLASQLILGKLKNQHNLIKYYNKYHKGDKYLVERYEYVSHKLLGIQTQIKASTFSSDDYAEKLMAFEAQAATAYWSYVRHLLEDDEIGFEIRIRKGATDIFNSLLNYGYAILYTRVWQALLSAKLNPSIGLLHVDQYGKPILAYDVIELFRSQAVDRVVIGLVQTGQPLLLDKGLLSEDTKKLLIKNILERLYRYEKYRSKGLELGQIIKEQVKDIAAYIKEEKKTFRPYVAKW